MVMKVTDEAGNVIELPVDKVEDITALQEKANRVEQLEKDVKPDWREARNTMDTMSNQIKTLTEKLKSQPEVKPAESGTQAQPLTAAEIEASSKKAAETVFDSKEADRIEKNRIKEVEKMAAGDDNRKQAIEAKYQEITGGRKIADPEEVASKLNDALFLVDKYRNAPTSGFNKMNSEHGGSGVNRGNTADKSKAVANLEAMGYQFRGDKNKLINK